MTPEPVTYTVTFDLNGADGAAPAGRSIAHGAAIGELPDVTRTGYTFLGWYTAASGGTQVTATTTVTCDMTLYAKWMANTYTTSCKIEVANGYTWIYEEEGDESFIVGIVEKPSGTLSFPAELGGKSVTSIGDYAFSFCDGLTSVTIPDSVTSIGDFAFEYCSGLTGVTIPDSVTSIGTGAFFCCGGMLSFEVAEGNSAYKSVSGLLLTKDGKTLIAGVNGNVTIPDSVTSIAEGAFNFCSGLTSVTIPDSVTSIGVGAFSWCSDSLYDTNSIPGVKLVDGWAVEYTSSPSGSLDLTGVRGIGNYAFDECTNLTSVTIGNGVTSIGSYAFYGCSGLTSVTIDNGVTSIEWGAFRDCSGLTSVTIPDSVTSIGDDVFYKCSGLTSVTIPDSVTSIGDYAFYGTTALKTVYVAKGDTDRVKSLLEGSREDVSGITFVEVGMPDPVAPNSVLANEVTYGGEVADAAFSKSQAVIGVLRDAKGSLAGIMEVKLGKKGKKGVKISAAATLLIDGKAKKVTAKAVTLADGESAKTLAFKDPIGEMAFVMAADGTFTLKSAKYEMVGAVLDDGATHAIKVGGNLPDGTMHFNAAIGKAPAFGAGLSLLEAALPKDVPVNVSGGKWSLDKAASLKYAKDKATGAYSLLGLDDPAKPNLSGLKLTYTAKNGLFKGSFKLYATSGGEKPKVKKFTVNVIGFVVDGKGMGEATCKKPAAGPWAVSVK